MPRTTKQFTISMPPEMAESVIDQAKRENRTVSELMREAYRAYREKQIRAIFEEIQQEVQANNPMGYTADDVPRLIKEVRQEMANEALPAR